MGFPQPLMSGETSVKQGDTVEYQPQLSLVVPLPIAESSLLALQETLQYLAALGELPGYSPSGTEPFELLLVDGLAGTAISLASLGRAPWRIRGYHRPPERTWGAPGVVTVRSLYPGCQPGAGSVRRGQPDRRPAGRHFGSIRPIRRGSGPPETGRSSPNRRDLGQYDAGRSRRRFGHCQPVSARRGWR